MTNRLTVHTAAIHTATIQVQTLTLSARQVTLSVFRQVEEENILPYGFTNGGHLKGIGWGYVLYCPGKGQCAWAQTAGGVHKHLVWQQGNNLYRCVIPWDVQASKWGQQHPQEAEALAALPQLFIAV